MTSIGLRSIETRLRRAGIEPSEIKALVKIGYADPPIEQTDRLIKMINGRVIGTDEVSRVDEEAMDALFTSVAYIADWTRAASRRSLRDPVDLQRGCAALPGTASRGNPAGWHTQSRPTLHCSAADWIRIATGQLNQQRAVFTRRLRPSGDLKLLLQLPRILPA